MQFSVQVQNARADAVEAEIGTAAILRVYSGSIPANTAAASTGTLLAQMTLPNNWMNNAASGQKTLLGVWQTLAALAAGTPGYFRIYNSAQTICGLQGTASVTGGGGELTFDIVPFVLAQQVSITTFTLTEANA